MEGEEGPTANVVVVETGVANIGSILHMLQRLGAKVSLRHFLKIVKNQTKYRSHFPFNARFSICACTAKDIIESKKIIFTLNFP